MSTQYQLPKNHQEAIIVSLDSLSKAEQHMVRAEACGLDCAQHRAQVDALRDRLDLVRTQFMGSPKSQ